MKNNHCRILVTGEPYHFRAATDLPKAYDEKDPDVFCEEYDAPEGYEDLIGHGILYYNDWCRDGTHTCIQVRRGKKWVNL